MTEEMAIVLTDVFNRIMNVADAFYKKCDIPAYKELIAQATVLELVANRFDCQFKESSNGSYVIVRM